VLWYVSPAPCVVSLYLVSCGTVYVYLQVHGHVVYVLLLVYPPIRTVHALVYSCMGSEYHAASTYTSAGWHPHSYLLHVVHMSTYPLCILVGYYTYCYCVSMLTTYCGVGVPLHGTEVWVYGY
jgi:hypothetical protein